MLVDFLIIGIGVMAIVIAGEIAVRNSIIFASQFRLSGTFIGMSILSIGTSFPETMAHIVGSGMILHSPERMDTLSSLLIGSNIGSDNFQQNFLLPLIAFVGTVIVHKDRIPGELGGLVGASILLWLFCYNGNLSRAEGTIMIAIYGAYLLFLWRSPAFADHSPPHKIERRQPTYRILIALTSCFTVMAVATKQVVEASSHLVDLLPVSASLFGVVILGIASATPEMVTSFASLLKGEKGISTGILIGSNITNPLFGVGLGAVISTYTIPQSVIEYDLPVKIGTSILLCIFLFRGFRLTKPEALIILSIFFAYIGFRPILFPTDVVLHG